MKPRIFAHRGASERAPENTMPAFELACELGADAFELDVQLTSDGELVVIHDDTVGRTSDGTGAVREKTYAELSALDFSNGMQGFEDVRIPLLKDVLLLARRNGIYVNAEIKEYDQRHAAELTKKLFELEIDCGMYGQILYSSFNHYLLRTIRETAPEKALAILYADGLVDVWEYAEKLGVKAVHPYFACLSDPALVPECHIRKLKVHPWTVNREEDLEAAFRAGVDGVITNRPDLALSVRSRVFPEN